MFAKKTWQMILSVLAACIVVYFLYHTVQGEHGWMSMLRLKNEVTTQEATLSQLRKEHEDLDHRIHLMRPDSLDPDLLDEESRKSLDYTKPNEIVILNPTEKKKQQ
jgi:cell division protein FtsB